jgi:DNA repair protein RadC
MRRLVRQCLESTFKKFKPKTVRAFRAWIAAEGVVKDAAKAIIVAHNHPSGDPTPSKQDIEFTEKVEQASKLLGIQLLDHIVIGNANYESIFSQREKILK